MILPTTGSLVGLRVARITKIGKRQKRRISGLSMQQSKGIIVMNVHHTKIFELSL